MTTTATVEKYLSLREVTSAFKVSPSTIWRWVKNNRFPKPIHLGPKAVRWREADIATWNQERAESEDETAIATEG